MQTSNRKYKKGSKLKPQKLEITKTTTVKMKKKGGLMCGCGGVMYKKK